MLALSLLFSVFLSCLPSAYAQINNEIIDSGYAPNYSSSGRDLFCSAANHNKVEQPRSGDYYSQPFTMYVNAPKGHSVYVYDYWSASDEHQIGTTFHGGRVTVLAAHGDYYCILFHEQDYQLKTAWVRDVHLTSWYPGETINIGGKSNRAVTNIGDPSMHWSRDFFVRTHRKYSFLDNPILNCVSFTLDYQLTSRNGSQTEDVLGPRDVYVNDGSGWIRVGSFRYDDRVACHVDITLPEPMTIAAVATIANCREPDNFVFRQSLLDVMCSSVWSR